ncbi:hypothetical protein [Nocardia sp. Marseille-Q1738]
MTRFLEQQCPATTIPGARSDARSELRSWRSPWPDEVDEVLGGDLTCAVAYLTPAGGAVVAAVAPIGLRGFRLGGGVRGAHRRRVHGAAEQDDPVARQWFSRAPRTRPCAQDRQSRGRALTCPGLVRGHVGTSLG